MSGFLIDMAARIAEPLKKQFRDAKKAYKEFVDDFVKQTERMDKAAQKSTAAGAISRSMTNKQEQERQRARQFHSPLVSLARQYPEFKNVLSQLYAQGTGRGMMRNIMRSGSQKGAQDLYNRFRSGDLQKRLKVEEKIVETEKKQFDIQKKFVPLLDRLNRGWQRLTQTKDKNAKKTAELTKLDNNYFGRLRRQIVGAIAAYVSFYSVARLGRSIFAGGTNVEQQAFEGQVAFGSKQNALSARHLAQQMGLRGSGFSTEDQMKGFTELMRAGVDPRKNYQMIADIAGKNYKQFNEVATDIVSAIYGDADVLRKYGLNNQQLFTLSKLVDKRPDTRKNVIMQMLAGNKSFKGGMNEFSSSWKGLMTQMKTWWEYFAESIMGSPSDKNSLYNRVKNVFQLIITWLQRNQQRIRRLGIAIGEVGKWVVRQIEQVGRWMAKRFEGFLSNLDGSTEKFQTTMMKVVLWLELTKMRIVDFFKRWGGLLKTFFYIWAGTKIWRMITGGIGSVVGALQVFGKTLKNLVTISETFVSVLARMAPYLVRMSPWVAAATAALWLQKKALDALMGGWNKYYGMLQKEAQKQAPNSITKQAQLISATQSLYRLGRGSGSIANTMASAGAFDAAALAAAGGNSNIIRPNNQPSQIAGNSLNSAFFGMLNRALGGKGQDEAMQGILKSGISADRIDKQYNFQQPITIIVQGNGNPVDTANQVKRVLEDEAAAGGFPNGMRSSDARKFMSPNK